MRNPSYDILFEPVPIGPLVAKNRFYQVPHCNGGGYRDPSAAAAMRGVKAEGGWGVIFTEQTEMHHSSEITPFIELRLWEDQDIPALRRMSEAMKTHGALAGIQLAYSGINGPNFYTKEVPLAPSALPIRTFTNDPVQARAMDKGDIRDLRRWFVNAARRSRVAGFDLICLYGAHGFGIFQHFLQPGDQPADRRIRWQPREPLAVRERGDRRHPRRRRRHDGRSRSGSVSTRRSGRSGFSNAEVRDFIAMNADLPDLWDLAQGTWEDCSGPSRFKEEAAQETLVAGIRELTSKPVVGVGRFTSPDVMARLVRQGVLDFIGCARPSIADPFLPRKIEEGRVEDIRECIGCNICITGDMTMSISRCTQNPTFMEEWRKGWHPERMNPKGASANVLVVGAGPAGLEAARALSLRGYDVALAEAGTKLGGRVARERLLPGLSAWGRVVDYREYQLSQRPNVETYFDSRLGADEIMEFGFENVAIATGARWRADGVARMHVVPMPIDPALPVFTPDDVMDGRLPSGEVVVFDDDHYYMGGVIAELLAQGRPHGDAGHALGLRLGLDAQHAGTGGDPSPAGRGRRADRAQHRGGGGAGGRRRDRVQLHRRRRPDRLRRRGHRRVAAVGGRALSRADGATGRLGRRRHPLGQGDRRRLRPGADRLGDLRRAPLRARARHARHRRRAAVPPRGDGAGAGRGLRR